MLKTHERTQNDYSPFVSVKFKKSHYAYNYLNVKSLNVNFADLVLLAGVGLLTRTEKNISTN